MSRTDKLSIDKVSSELIQQWAIKDLRMPGVSSSSRFNSLCRADIEPTWKYLINNVTNHHDVQQITGNIKAQRHAIKLSSEG